jgi:histidinol-phosphate aminotransferase
MIIGIVVNFYPDASVYGLKHALSELMGVQYDQIFCGTGTDLLIRVICMTVLSPGDESIMGEVTFSRYDDGVKLMGGKSVRIPMKSWGLDIEGMVNAITPKTKIIWFCNPNNPTGTAFTQRDIEGVLDRIPPNVLVVMDEAYGEYVTSDDFPDTLSCLNKYPNMVLLKTLSKAYGLAGLRIGYGICSRDLARHFNSVIGPFDVNLPAQVAAVSALKDREFIKRTYEHNRQGKEYLYSRFTAMGLPYIKSEANFIAVNVMTDDNIVFQKLLKKGVIVKSGSSLGMPGYLRVSIGTMEHNKKFIEALEDILKALTVKNI